MLADFALLLFAFAAVTLAGPLIWHFRQARQGGKAAISKRSAGPGRGPRLVLGGLCFAYFIIYLTLAIRQHLALRSQAFDLGIFDQIMWNSAHGRLFINSLTSDSPNHLGHHFSPLLLVVMPLYWVWPDPRTLLVLQTAVLALAAVPLYLWAEQRVGALAALTIAFCYLAYPALGFVNLFDFHEIALAVPLLSLALYFLLNRRYRGTLVCLAAALLLKEEVAVVVVAFGLYILLFQRARRLGLALMGAGLVYGALAVFLVIPSFQSSHTYIYLSRYAYLGNSLLEILGTLATRPQVLVEHLLTPGRLEFVLSLLVPLGLLPLVGWEIALIALPSMVYLLTGDARMVSIGYQYSAILIVPLFFATVEGVRRVTSRWPSTRASLLVALLVVSLGSYYLYGRGPLSRNFQRSLYATAGRAARGRAFLAQIPPQAAVSAQNNLGPHLSQREHLYLFPEMYDAEYVVLDLAGDSWPLTRGQSGTYDRAVDRLRSDPTWRLERREGDFLLFVRQAPPNATRYALGDCLELVGHDAEQREQVLHVRLFWRATCRDPRAYTVFTHLVRQGDASGRIWAQQDNQPVHDTYPTTTWEPGRVVTDEYAIPLGGRVPAGSYVLNVGMYVSPDGPRLDVHDAAGEAIGQSIPLMQVQVGQ